MTPMEVLFWLSVGLVGYVYVGYPVLLRVWAALAPKPLQTGAPEGFVPGVSIVIAARNEGRRLAARLDKLLSLDYPAQRRQIIVVSDGSTDNTPDVLARYAPDVEAVSVPAGGKALALNAGVARARHDVIVFADARQTFAPDALRQLVGPLEDERVGGTTGELRLDCEAALFGNRRTRSDRRAGGGNAPVDGVRDRRAGADRRRTLLSTIADGVGLYWRYEKELRRLESAIGSTLGATGCIYAIRRSAWRPLPADTLLDDVLTPMRVVLGGRRVVFNDKAVAFDRAEADADAETRRKVRTLAGNFQILSLEPRLLLPILNPVWVQYASHKVGRLLVPYALLAAFAANVGLASSHVFYQAVLAAQVGFYLLAGYGAVLELSSRRSASPARRPAAVRASHEALSRGLR